MPEQDLEGLRLRIMNTLAPDPDDHSHSCSCWLSELPITDCTCVALIQIKVYVEPVVRLVQAEVAAAQELFWLRGYEAGFAVGSGNLKGEPWAVVEQRLLKERPGLAKLVDPPQQPPTEGGSE
jgi:hypothetical protein